MNGSGEPTHAGQAGPDNDRRASVAENTAARARLKDPLERASDAELERPLDGEWTVGAVLAHLAFWDRFVQARWEFYGREGAVLTLSDALVNLINAANLPAWRALEPRRAAELAVSAAEACDAHVAGLSVEAVAAAAAVGAEPMGNRWMHRGSHLAELERVLRAPEQPPPSAGPSRR